GPEPDAVRPAHGRRHHRRRAGPHRLPRLPEALHPGHRHHRPEVIDTKEQHMSQHLDPRHTPLSRRAVIAGGLAASLTVATAPSALAGPGVGPRRPGPLPGGVDRATLLRWAEDTWASLAAMTPSATGLPADNITGDLSTRSGYTSPTNIGG